MSMIVHLFIAFFVAPALLATLVPEAEIKAYLTAEKNVVAFYNVYAGGKHFSRIVNEQVQTLKGSGLLDKLDSVYYATNGEHGRHYNIDDSPKFVHISHKDTGSELDTMSLLYQFCSHNPNSKVLYFHDKGSYHHRRENEQFRKALNCYVLNAHCLNALDNHDMCGWRLSPIPVPHYSGNFWWARCSYINTLIDPLAQYNNLTFIEKSKELDCVGVKDEDRYFAEFWIATGPTFRPADCMNASIDTSYVCGYSVPKVAYNFCHGPDVPSGLVCDTASTYKDAPLFRVPANLYKITMGECQDIAKYLVKRSQVMYGQDPHTYLEWMEKMFPKPTENSLYRFHDSQEVFIMKNGVLRSVPNLKTFISLGRDFDEVKELISVERRTFEFGEPLPSV